MTVCIVRETLASLALGNGQPFLTLFTITILILFSFLLLLFLFFYFFYFMLTDHFDQIQNCKTWM